MRGRKPIPAEIREQQGGSAISHRPQAPAAVVGEPVDVDAGDELAAPEYLHPLVIEVWNEIVPALAAVGLARTVDVPALEALCGFVAHARYAADQIADPFGGFDNLVTETDKGTPVVSPWARVYRDSWAAALKLAEHYGLTPISRTRLGIAALQQKSLAEQLKGIMEDDDPGTVEGEATEEAEFFDATVCLGCGVEKGRRHLPGCERPGFSYEKTLDPGTVIARRT